MRFATALERRSRATLPATPPDSGIGFARSGDKVGLLSNRQCKSCGGRCFHDVDGYACAHCGPQAGRR